MFACCFCDQTYPSIERLACHLIDSHPLEAVLLTRRWADFCVRRTRGGPFKGRLTVLCLCGEVFTTAQITPLFASWGERNIAEKNSFLAHLFREGGIVPHLERLRDEDLLDSILPRKVDSDGRITGEEPF